VELKMNQMAQENSDSARSVVHARPETGIETGIRTIQGFTAYILKSQQVELAVVPALGAKIISLKDLSTGREWLWHPGAAVHLFTNQPTDDFPLSPLVGVDECLPTVASCSWQDRQLPDHGEVWSLPWSLDGNDWTRGKITTRVHLKISPFEFERTVELIGNCIQLNYKLKNLSMSDESYIWAMHPLLRFENGDQLELPSSTSKIVNAGKWNAPITSVIPEPKCLKAFARPVTEGRAMITNARTGDRLEFSWHPAENDTLGLWLTRGGWHGHHHLAIEPTNATDDSLSIAARHNEAGRLPANGTKVWSVTLRVGF
jgi:hypothetical protein